jgi:hypothetical protein
VILEHSEGWGSPLVQEEYRGEKARDNRIIIIIIIIIIINLNSISRKHEIKELQKTAILCTAHVLWKVLT